MTLENEVPHSGIESVFRGSKLILSVFERGPLVSLENSAGPLTPILEWEAIRNGQVYFRDSTL